MTAFRTIFDEFDRVAAAAPCVRVFAEVFLHIGTHTLTEPSGNGVLNCSRF